MNSAATHPAEEPTAESHIRFGEASRGPACYSTWINRFVGPAQPARLNLIVSAVEHSSSQLRHKVLTYCACW